MKNIFIRVIDDEVKYYKKKPYLVGEIIINDFREEFEMSLSWWTKEDYERQWKEGLARLEHESLSCLVTKIKNPHDGPFIDWWLLYKRDDKVYIQNQWLFREYYEETIGSENFTVENCYTFIRPYQSGLPDGTHISEWVVELR